jgi:hypothetical protein
MAIQRSVGLKRTPCNAKRDKKEERNGRFVRCRGIVMGDGGEADCMSGLMT